MKVIYDLKMNLLQYSETLELFSITEPNRIKHEFAESELFQYFDVFMSSVRSIFIGFECFYMVYLMHLNDFYEFDSIEPNSKKHQSIEIIRFGSIELIRLNSVRYSRKVLEFHCKLYLQLFTYKIKIINKNTIRRLRNEAYKFQFF
jgi:hypothetical protein